MKVDISSLNRKTFKIVIGEQQSRDEWTRNQFKTQIENGDTCGDSEGFKETYEKYKKMELYFIGLNNKVSRNKYIDISNEEIEFINYMIEDQLYVSKDRIKDWQPTGKMYVVFKSKYLDDNPDGDLNQYEECVREMIKYDEDLIDFCNELSKLINIK